MSIQRPASPVDLVNYIKARLGINVHTVELTEDQYNIILEDALERFYAYVYDGYEEVFEPITMPEAGVYTLDDDVLSVSDVMGAYDYVQANLPFMVSSASQITDNKRYNFEFSITTHKLTIQTLLSADTAMGVKVYKKYDATVYTDIYNHPWLKRYAVALAKKQWADNISKYGSVILPGGMTLESDTIMTQAIAELEASEEDLFSSYAYKPLPQIH